MGFDEGTLSPVAAAYKRVLALAPDDKEAREALGFVQVDGRWLTEEESYRARGFVNTTASGCRPPRSSWRKATPRAEPAREVADKRASDAEFKSSMDRLQKQEDDKRARDEADRMRNNPVYRKDWAMA